MLSLKQNLVYLYLMAKHKWLEDLTEGVKNLAVDCLYRSDKIDKLITKVMDIDFNNSAIEYFVRQYTLSEDERDGDIQEIYTYIKESCGDWLKKVSVKDDLLNIETEENFFQVGKLSDSIIDEKDRLQSRNRIGLCHSDSIKLGLRIAEDCSIVTGKIWTVSGKNKCLHSWVEIPREGKESLCADYTINAVMQKSGYYRLHHIDENSVNSIHISEIRNDINELDNYTDKYTFLLKEYLVGKKDFAKKLYGFGGELSGQKIEENLYSSFDEMEK